MHLGFLGRPPSLPFFRAAAALALVETAPPSFPISAAIQRFEPRKPSINADPSWLGYMNANSMRRSGNSIVHRSTNPNG
jgi:hypothetical protein